MTLRAGAATRDITPTRPTALFGYPHVKRISTGVHDPLLASVLYLASGSSSAVLIALDLLFLDPPTSRSIRRAVSRSTSVPVECIFISCTHTHSGPVTSRLLSWRDDPAVPPPDPLYLELVSKQVVEAAAEAASESRPAEIAWTTAEARGVGGNRILAGGLTDPRLGILAVRQSGDASLAAAVLIYGMHPTVLHEDSTLVSSDFPHYTRRHLAERFGRELAVLYHTAPCGDQSPRHCISGQTFEEAERLGRRLGEAAAVSLEGLGDGDFKRDCPLGGALRAVDLPRRRLPSAAEARRRLDECRTEFRRLEASPARRSEVRTAECAVFGAEGTLALAGAQQQGLIDQTLETYRPIEIQVLRIGDGHLVGLPGELFAEYALAIKRRAAANTFVVSLAGGELQGYIVTPEADAAGGYEAANSLFSPEAGQMMVEAAVSMISQGTWRR